ncbi:MAG TPA: hypothetical protein VMT53_12445 [Terriglobales bacterium]|nr:hypothetical protein [Terriglobales bacterium]
MLLVVLFPGLLAAECVPFTDAAKHIGTSQCVTGKVVKVTRLDSGTTFLNFCEDYRTCPFQVVIFPSDLRHVGDIRQLEGRMIEIEGDIKEYDRHPEIILRDAGQLRGAAAKIPPMPKGYDVENKGRFSAGKMNYPKASKPRKKPSHQDAPRETEAPEIQQ